MGEVYLAYDEVLRRQVAVKLGPDATARERFMVEAHAIAQLQHPNVIRVYDFGELDGRPYIVLELLAGKTLDKIHKPMHWSRALDIGIKLSRGLAAAHQSGTLHRDIKPSNAILTDDGRVVLFDFGLAKFTTRPSECGSQTTCDAGPQALTAPGAFVGTPDYMAPERWRAEPATARSDVYSLGAVLFELCAGRPPYGNRKPHTLALAVQTQDAPLLTEVVPEIDPGFARVLARCLSRDPLARYASGKDVREALEGLKRRARTRARRTNRPRMPRRLQGRR